jgi:hypothetical protein
VRHPLTLIVVAIALAGLVASGATTPHVHDAGGVYNQEHDLTAFATLSGVALPAAAPGVVPVPVVVATTGFVLLAVADTPVRAAASRAPPRA